DLMGWIGGNRGGKFFVFIHVMGTHDPYLSRAPYNTMFGSDYNGSMPALDRDGFWGLWKAKNAELKSAGKSEIGLDEFYWALADDRNIDEVEEAFPGYRRFISSVKGGGSRVANHDRIVALYDGTIREADAFFGKFIEGLESEGLLDESIIIVNGDHGEGFNEHGLYGHSYGLYEELLHIPLALRLPGQADGARVKAQVRMTDMLPTLITLLGLKVEQGVKEQMDGVDIFRAVKENPEYVFPIFQKYDTVKFQKSKIAKETSLSLQSQDGWKVIYNLHTDEIQLCNFGEDRFCTENVAESEPEKTAQMKETLFKHFGYAE
ncbi:MAG: sulfatase-like hydrolase/transferase, partial [Candidatus Diapherotrites archaeon]